MRLLATFLVLLVACGDDAAKNAPAATPPKPAAAPGAGSGSAVFGKPLPPMRHAEDRVNCPTPRSGSKKCDPNATKPVVIGNANPAEKKADDLTCGENEVCLNTTEGFLCGPCPERFAIRHDFKDRDFAPETNRDPFQSFVVKVPGAGTGSGGELPKDPTSRCVRNDQLRVTNYGYQDLKLVGIVSQGTQRKVLLMDPGNYGHIIKRGDCVGKEKAWVKDIGENFICFEMSSEQAAANRLPEGMCIELHNKQLTVTQLPIEDKPATTGVTPVLPGTGSAAPPPRTGGTTTTTTTIRPQPQPEPQPQQPPAQAPTNIRP